MQIKLIVTRCKYGLNANMFGFRARFVRVSCVFNEKRFPLLPPLTLIILLKLSNGFVMK